jgi:hypothetical protein
MTVAAIDRLVHHATILEIVAPSYRKATCAEEAHIKSGNKIGVQNG